jgi:hypothetical protein
MDIHAKLSKLTAGKYMKPVDFDGELPVVVTIADINEEIMPSQETVFVMTFHECEKGLVLKPGRLMELRDIFGDDVILSDTIGKKIQLYGTTTTYKGQKFPVIQFEKPPAPKKFVPTLKAEFEAKTAAIKQANEASYEADSVPAH